MADSESREGSELASPLPDGIVPEAKVVQTERRWSFVVTGTLLLFASVIIVTGITNGLHPPSSAETIDPARVYQSPEFSETNIGTALNADGSATVRMIAQQYSFVPRCVTVPEGAKVTFRLTSPDVVHGFLIGSADANTNVNAMVVPGYVTEATTRFQRSGTYRMPCHEFCGTGHAGMAAEVRVVAREQFPDLSPTERMTCGAQ